MFYFTKQQENTVTPRWGIYDENDVLVEGGFSSEDAAEEYMYDHYVEENLYEPTEADEWFSFDPDC